jgi:hypothetical protein
MTVEKQQAQMFLDAAARLQAEKVFNFCPRCGKRLVGDERHTCTPPKEKT